MTATAIARNGGGRSDNNGGVDVRVKLKSEKGSSPNTSMAGGNDTSSASTTLSNQSSGGSSQGTANGVIAERESITWRCSIESRRKRNERARATTGLPCTVLRRLRNIKSNS